MSDVITEALEESLVQNNADIQQQNISKENNEENKENEENTNTEDTSLKDKISETLMPDDPQNTKDDEKTKDDKIENNEQNSLPPENNNNVENQTVAVDIDLDANNEVQINSKEEKIENKSENAEIPKNNDDQSAENDTEKSSKESNTSPISPAKTKAALITPKKSNGSQTMKVLNRKQFVSLMRGEPLGKHRSKTVIRTRPLSSTVPSTKIPSFADEAIAGKNIHMSDALAVTEIIDELISRRVKALDENNYLEAQKINEAMYKLRLNYRVYDREALYNMIIRQLTDRKSAAEDDLAETKRVWKEKWAQLEQKQNEQIDELYKRHIKEHEDFEDYWRDPSNYSQYTKRSANQLEHIAVERALVITGRFLEAEQFKKMNEKSEKAYKVEQSQKLQARFEDERAKLIHAQELDLEQLKYQNEAERKRLEEREKIEINVKKLTVENMTRILEDEKEFGNFCAHTYKRSPSTVVPPTVSTKGGNDLPPMPPGRIFPRGVEDKVKWTKKSPLTPISLPTLKFKRYKVPNYNEKPKKDDDDDDL